MTLSELVAHNHRNRVSQTNVDSLTAKNTFPAGQSSTSSQLRSTTFDYENINEGSDAGASQPFNIMQPYLALNCCRQKVLWENMAITIPIFLILCLLFQ